MIQEIVYDFTESKDLSVSDLAKVFITHAFDKNSAKQWIRILKIEGDKRWILNSETGWRETFIGEPNTNEELFEVL